ncbi:MAG TPA: hypothetical protein VG326_09990 [Tepidisphaeraceae bacterium]|jgi:glucose/arabinose dehydrogenase|nr:hypothetical protein [Tepidisphaeraceae bacterium]
MFQAVQAQRKRIRFSRLADVPMVRFGMALAVAGLVGGCLPPPRVLTPDEQHTIDRQQVEYPAGYELRRYATGFTAPTAMAFDADGSLLVAEGVRGEEPRIWRVTANGKSPTLFYPRDDSLLPFRIPRTGWRMYGPIGGMVVHDGNVIVTHRDGNDLGVVTALDSKGGHKTICAGFPAEGDYGLTDLAIDPRTGRLWFACGSVTNSGVVGMDNWAAGWVREHPDAHDIPFHDIEELGYKFQTTNPLAGLFGPADIAVTAAFQAFNQSFAIRVRGSPDGKPSGAIYSVAADGGFATVEAYGVHHARGIAFNEFGQPYITNDGMEMRGTRPIKNDPDSLVRLPPGQPWLGWPEFSTDFEPIGDAKFQPPEWMIAPTGYPQVRSLIDQKASGLSSPVRETLLETAFPSLSGAAKMTFAPTSGPFKEFQGSVIIAFSGDRTPFASGGITLPRPVGFKIVRVDLDRHVTRDFIRNVGDLPGSKIDDHNHYLTERPVDVKFGPDGALYILDEGQMEVKHAQERFKDSSGQIFRLIPITPTAATRK